MSAVQSKLCKLTKSNVAIVAPTSRLYNLILMKKPWNVIQRRATQFPMDTAWRNSHGMTPLHITCCLRPPSDVVKALMNFNNGATCSIPSHGKGNLPLHLACLKEASYDVIKCLLQNGKSTAKTSGNHYPVSLLVKTFLHKQQGEFVDEVRRSRDPMVFSQDMTEFWSKATLLLRAMLRHNKAGEGKFDVPSTLPAFSPLLIQQSAFAVSQFKVPSGLKDLVLRVFHHHIESFPSVCRILNAEGKYLLNVALANNLFDQKCIESMLRAAPKVLYISENKNYLFPFMLAATCHRIDGCSEEYDREWLNTVYCILRATPDLVLDRTTDDFYDQPITDGRKRGRDNIATVPNDRSDNSCIIVSPDNRKKHRVIS